MVGYARQSSALIVTSAVIEASHFNNEYNAILDAMSAATGHTHDGTTGGGALIPLATAISGTLAVGNGGTGATTASAARTALGLVIGTNVQAYGADLTNIAALAVTDSNFIVGDGATWVAESGATVRTSLGLGTLATASTINNSNWSGTALAVANGGTASTTAAAARTALGLVIGTDVQAQDAGLLSIAGLTTAANKGIYTTASDVYATYDLTAAGLALLDDAAASNQRTTLGLVIGTNVQAYDAGLLSIAGLTTAADTLIYTTASDVYATTTLTAAGRALLDDAAASNQRTTLGSTTVGDALFITASAAAARTTLGLGTAAVVNTGTTTGLIPLVGTTSATDALAGTVELATSAETITGTDTVRAVTPAGLAAANPQGGASIFVMGGGAIAAGQTIYYGQNAGSTDEFLIRLRVPFAGTADKLYVNSYVNIGAGETYVCMVRLDQGNTTLTATISGVSQAAADTSNSFTFIAGQYLDIRVVASGGAATSSSFFSSIRIRPY